MRFASVTHEGHALAVAIDGDVATPLLNISELGRGTSASFLSEPPLYDKVSFPVSKLTFRPVVPNPGKVICIGLNYLAHIQETQNQEHEYPVLFTKFATSLTGPYDDIPRPPESSAMDYEGELAVVIGEHIRRVSRDEALAAVAGYTVANDITMRDYQYKSPQWLQGKAWEAATPLGPWLVTPDEVGDVGSLSLETTVNGQVVQEASTKQMIFDIATLISTISEFTSLDPGDLILTGTPSGVGFRREPKLLLGDGDVVVVEIEKVGRLENRIVDEPGVR
jgi:acylpyruvate hydrolase